MPSVCHYIIAYALLRSKISSISVSFYVNNPTNAQENFIERRRIHGFIQKYVKDTNLSPFLSFENDEVTQEEAFEQYNLCVFQ